MSAPANPSNGAVRFVVQLVLSAVAALVFAAVVGGLSTHWGWSASVHHWIGIIAIVGVFPAALLFLVRGPKQ